MSKLSFAYLAMIVVALTACGDGGGSGGDAVPPVANIAPVANAGAAQSVNVAASLTLNGSASSDANADSLAYSWTLTSKPTGSAATLTGVTSAAPTFTADLAVTDVASLGVNDGKVSSAAATVTVVAISPAIQLFTVPGSSCLFSCTEIWVALPFSTSATLDINSTCIGSGCVSYKELHNYKLSATAANFTVIEVQAVNLMTGFAVAPSFIGLSNGQVFNAGSAVTFKVVTSPTTGATVNLRFSYKIA